MGLSSRQRQGLEEVCKTMRRDILHMIYKAGSGHPGGSLSCVEIVAALYFYEMDIDPANPDCAGRDRFILSKGHACPTVYSALGRRGFFDVGWFDSLRKLGSPLQGHPQKSRVPGLDCSAGSLGQGLSVANGLCIAAKKQANPRRTYCLLGDGELQEGQVWEAVMTAAHYKLDNLCALVDYNAVQLDGNVRDIMNVEPLKEKFLAFNWNVIEIDGHDICAVIDALEAARSARGLPTVILAKCIKGKGVSFMENEAAWHGAAPNEQQYKAALAELDGEGV
jgi:transketolase